MLKRAVFPMVILALALAWLTPALAAGPTQESRCYLDCVQMEMSKYLSGSGSGEAIMAKCRDKCRFVVLRGASTPHEQCVHACYQKLWDCQKICFAQGGPHASRCLENCKQKYLDCIGACGDPRQ